MAFNPTYFYNEQLHQLRPPAAAFTTIVTSDNIAIGISQGNRGANPALDFKVRILLDGIENKPILPKYIYWVVDLMLKYEAAPVSVREILEYYLNFYNSCTPFNDATQRINYQFMTLDYIRNYQDIQCQNTLSLEYVAVMIELFCLNEKQTPKAFWFYNLLEIFYRYINEEAGYLDLLIAAQPGLG